LSGYRLSFVGRTTDDVVAQKAKKFYAREKNAGSAAFGTIIAMNN